MSLTYDTRAIEESITSDADGYLNPVTHALIFATIGVGIGHITSNNHLEFAARLEIWQDLNGAMLGNSEGPVRIEALDVQRHIGLRTNASFKDETRAAWLKRTTADYFRHADQAKREIKRSR